EALAAVGEEPVDGVRQIAVIGEVEGKPFAEPLCVFAVTGEQDRIIHRAPFGDAHHAGSAGTDAFDRLIAGINLFYINSWSEVLRHSRSPQTKLKSRRFSMSP